MRLADLRLVAADLALSYTTHRGHSADLPDQSNPSITGTAIDSRRARPGDLFAALPGRHVHGAIHAADAVASGAVAVLTDQAGEDLAGPQLADVPFLVVDDPSAVLGLLAAAVHGHPARDLSLVGVTGTNGKTTTTCLVEAALRAAGQVTGLIGTVEERIGPRTRPSPMTTPDTPDLQRLLADMRDAGVDTVAMECSSHALVQHRLAGLVFDVVAFTNLSREHLDYHGSMEAYYQAKARLFTPGVARAGVVVVDDPWGRRLAATTQIPIITLSSTNPAAAPTASQTVAAGERALAAAWYVDGTPGSDHFTLAGPDTRLTLHSPVAGEHNKVNTAVAALVLLQLGFRADRVMELLAAPVKVPGRMQRLPLGPGAPTVVVDFAHTPDAVAKAASSLRLRTTGRLVLTVSAGGDRDPGKRAPIGRAAALSGADVLVVTDDHPRHEDPAAIRVAVLRGIDSGLQALRAQGARLPRVIEVAQGRRHALEVALAAAGPTGTVGFFGLGPDRYQHIGPAGTRVPFVETEEIEAAWTRLRAQLDDHVPAGMELPGNGAVLTAEKAN